MSKDAAALYRVRNWEDHYENHITRKIKHLNWVATPNKHDGRGFRRLLRMPDGIALYGAWHIILQVASKMPKRGTLADEDGPLTPEDISDKTGAPADLIRRALRACSSPEVGWLEVSSTSLSPAFTGEQPLILPQWREINPGTAGESPAMTGRSAAIAGDSAAMPGVIEQKEQKEQNRTEEECSVFRTTNSAECSPHYTTEISDDDPIFPGQNVLPGTISKFNNDSGQALDQLARDLVNRLIARHWTASNAPAATGRLERILAEAVHPERTAAAIEANHESWYAWHMAHRGERKKRLEYWLADGDYLHPVSGYSAAPAVPVIDESPLLHTEHTDEELAELDARMRQERLQEALR